MRVLVLIKGLGLGGAETLIAHASLLWDHEAFDYRVAYLLPWKDQLVRRLEERGVQVECLDWRGPASFGAVGRLRHLVKAWQPDIIHSHLPIAGVLARLSVPSPRHVYTEHNVVDYYRQPTRSLNRLTYGRNDAVIAVSEAVAESISAYPGPEPIVVPNGVVVARPSKEELTRVRSELGIGIDTPLVVHVGNIRPHKGHNTLIDAVALLAKDRPEAVFVSIGAEKHEGDLDRVRAKARDLGIQDRIRFLGRREDALTYMAAADVVVNPSDVEGLPLSVLEALSLGRPVVATAVGGVPSVVLDNVTGILVDPGDPRQLAGAIVRAIESPDSGMWGDAGARLVSRDHGLAGMIERYEAIYRRLGHQ
jgi:glycosyltransferase involved in cell wall biosynthesis